MTYHQEIQHETDLKRATTFADSSRLLARRI